MGYGVALNTHLIARAAIESDFGAALWMTSKAIPRDWHSTNFTQDEQSQASLLSYTSMKDAMNGDTFWVEDDMVKLAAIAADSLVNGAFLPILHLEDMLAPHGFAYFDEPWQPGGTLPIRAIAWSTGLFKKRMGENEIHKGSGIEFAIFADGGAYPEEAVFKLSQFLKFKGFPTSYMAIVPMYSDSWMFDIDVDFIANGPQLDSIEGDTVPPPDLVRGFIYSLFHLATQQSVKEQPISRQLRRRHERNGDVPKVSVVSLKKRRRRLPSGRTVEVAYDHRWMVRGHWRNQWYPAYEAHKPIWIQPHVKGPDDMPLVMKEKVIKIEVGEPAKETTSGS